MHSFIEQFLHNITWMTIAKENAGNPKTSENTRKKAREDVSEHLRWFGNLSHPSMLDKQFRPYLVQEPPKRPWLLRWP
jgi:hypothetical protein